MFQDTLTFSWLKHLAFKCFAIQVLLEDGLSMRCEAGSTLSDLRYRVIDQHGVAFDQPDPSWFNASQRRGRSGVPVAGGIGTAVRASWCDRPQALAGDQLPPLMVS